MKMYLGRSRKTRYESSENSKVREMVIVSKKLWKEDVGSGGGNGSSGSS